MNKEKLKSNTMKCWWVFALIAIVVFSFWIRSIPAKYGELQALDPFYAYRMSTYLLEHNFQLPGWDHMRYWPDGIGPHDYGPIVYFYAPALLYLVFGFGMTFLEWAILYPAIMGAVSVLIIFFIGKEIFDSKEVGLMSAVFLATVPAYLSRTTAGFFDKESTGGTLMLLALYFFIISYKRSSWKLGIVGGVSCGLALVSWGGAGFILYFLSAFVLINIIFKYEDRISYSAIPFFVTAIIVEEIIWFSSLAIKELFAIFVVIIVSIQYLSKRFNLVEERRIGYIPIGLFILGVLAILISAMFLDYSWALLEDVAKMFSFRKSLVGITVAEQMPGTWADIQTNLSVYYAKNIFDFSSIEIFVSIWFLMFLGLIAIAYKFYRTRNWLLLLPAIWLLMSLQTVFYMVRLMFFLAPSASLVAGFFVIFIIEKVRKIKPSIYADAICVILLAVLITANLLTGYVMCNSVGPSFNTYWAEAMDFVRTETPINSSILSWWDFGYWFQTKGERPSIADGGNNNESVNEQIADWFVDDASEWENYFWWFESKDVDYILMDYTLPGKYGAISTIASRGKGAEQVLQFKKTSEQYTDSGFLNEFKGGGYALWLIFSNEGYLVNPPMLMPDYGDGTYGRKAYVRDICSVDGITTLDVNITPQNDVVDGCISISSLGVAYLPPSIEHSIFNRLMFMDGWNIPIEKVFDNEAIKIYKVEKND